MNKVIVFIAVSIFLAFGQTYDSNSEIKTKTQLGEKLFFDPIMSKDSTISCADCHKPSLAFADSVAISKGVNGKIGIRNAQSVMNMTSRRVFFYDGRAKTLRDQVHFPVEDPMEMDFSMQEAIKRLNSHPEYRSHFKSIFNEIPNEKNIIDAITAFEESLETADTEFDAWMTNRPNTMSPSAIRGREIFLSERAKCFDCHFSPDFTIDEFKNISLYDEKKYKDKGRYLVTKEKSDLGKFKVPGLRNIAVTAPYMHDGSFKTLAEVVEYYSNPSKFISNPINIDSTLQKPINFTADEKSDLIDFLRSLTDRRFYKNKLK